MHVLRYLHKRFLLGDGRGCLCLCCERVSNKRSFFQYRRATARKVGPLGYALLIVPTASFGLGCWQIYRWRRKLAFIKDMESRLYEPAVALPENLDELASMEYRAIRVRGEFDHSREFLIRPRSKLMQDKQGGGGGSLLSSSAGVGAQVVTPFRLADRNLRILVNRGWVPKKRENPESRMRGQVVGPLELVGIVRLNEKRPPFVGPNKPEYSQWTHRDIQAMADLCDTSPVYLEAVAESSVPEGPIGGQTHVTVRNEHVSYIITWYVLSFLVIDCSVSFIVHCWLCTFGPSRAIAYSFTTMLPNLLCVLDIAPDYKACNQYFQLTLPILSHSLLPSVPASIVINMLALRDSVNFLSGLH